MAVLSYLVVLGALILQVSASDITFMDDIGLGISSDIYNRLVDYETYKGVNQISRCHPVYLYSRNVARFFRPNKSNPSNNGTITFPGRWSAIVEKNDVFEIYYEPRVNPFYGSGLQINWERTATPPVDNDRYPHDFSYVYHRRVINLNKWPLAELCLRNCFCSNYKCWGN